jgi:hypothetical protein
VFNQLRLSRQRFVAGHANASVDFTDEEAVNEALAQLLRVMVGQALGRYRQKRAG